LGIGGEADGGVEGRVRADIGHRLRIQRQPELQALQGIHRQRAEQVEEQNRLGIAQPTHLLVLAHAAKAIESVFQAVAEAALHDGGDILAQGPGRQQQDQQKQPKQ